MFYLHLPTVWWRFKTPLYHTRPHFPVVHAPSRLRWAVFSSFLVLISSFLSCNQKSSFPLSEGKIITSKTQNLETALKPFVANTSFENHKHCYSISLGKHIFVSVLTSRTSPIAVVRFCSTIFTTCFFFFCNIIMLSYGEWCVFEYAYGFSFNVSDPDVLQIKREWSALSVGCGLSQSVMNPDSCVLKWHAHNTSTSRAWATHWQHIIWASWGYMEYCQFQSMM